MCPNFAIWETPFWKRQTIFPWANKFPKTKQISVAELIPTKISHWKGQSVDFQIRKNRSHIIYRLGSKLCCWSGTVYVSVSIGFLQRVGGRGATFRGHTEHCKHFCHYWYFDLGRLTLLSMDSFYKCDDDETSPNSNVIISKVHYVHIRKIQLSQNMSDT